MSQKTPVNHVRYASPMRWLYGIMAGFYAIAAPGLVMVLIFSPVNPVIVLIVMAILAWNMWRFSRRAWAIETRPEGLSLTFQFPFGSAVISYAEIQRISIRSGRDWLSLNIYTRGQSMAAASIWAGLTYAPGGGNRIDPLIHAIRGASHLTKFSETLYGFPTYERER